MLNRENNRSKQNSYFQKNLIFCKAYKILLTDILAVEFDTVDIFGAMIFAWVTAAIDDRGTAELPFWWEADDATEDAPKIKT